MTLVDLAKNKATARAEAKKLTIPQLENLIEGLTNAFNIKKEEAAKIAAETAIREEKAKELADLISQSGLTLEEISQLSSMKVKGDTRSNPVLPKYMLEIDGEEHLWSGRGRTPKVFQQYFDEGNTKESCAIPAE